MFLTTMFSFFVQRVCNLVPFLSNTSGEERQQELPFLLFPELKEYRNLLLNSTSNNTITQLSESLGLLLNSTSNETITLLPESFDAIGTLQMLDMLFGTIAEIFSCVDHEYFQGYNNEESMVKRAVNTSALPTIASKYFGGFSLLYIMILSYPKLFYFLKFFLLYLILSFQPRPRSSWQVDLGNFNIEQLNL